MGEAVEKEWNNENKLNLLINNCLIIENKIKGINEDIKIINENKSKMFIEIFIKWNLNSINKDITDFVKVLSLKNIQKAQNSRLSYHSY